MTLALCVPVLPALAAPTPEYVPAPILAEQASDLSRLPLDPSVVFAKKDGKGGGGGSGNSGTGNGKDKDGRGGKSGKDDRNDEDDKEDKKEGKNDDDEEDKEDKEDKKDKKDGKRDEDGKKDKKDKKEDKKDGKKEGKNDDDEEDKKDKKDDNEDGDDKKEGEKDDDDKKDKKEGGNDDDEEDKKDKKDKKDGKKDEDGKKDKKDKKEDKKDGKKDEDDKEDKRGKKDGKKDKKNEKEDDDEDGGESGDRDDDHDHDRNERHDHDNETADGRHDHRNEERRHDHGEEEADAGSGDEPPADDAGAASSAAPGVVTLSWTPPVENEDGSPLTDLAGYRVYWRNTAGDISESLYIDNPGLSTVVIENLDAGTYEFVMTSLNSEGIESGRSNSVTRVVEGPVNPGDGQGDATGQEKTNSPAGDAAPDAGDPASDTPPYLMISGIPPEAVTAGELYLFAPTVESNTETPPAFAIDGLPHWAGFDEVSGELYGTPDFADLGLYEAIAISATDGVVETSLPLFSIEVVAPGAALGAVTLSWTPPDENEDGTYLADLAGYWIYWGNNPGIYTEWLRVDNPGLTMIVIEDLVPGTWEFAMTSFNADGVESRLSNTVTRILE